MIEVTLPEYSLVFEKTDLQTFREELHIFPGGIYFLFDESDNCLYIGKSKNLYSRLLQHRRGKYADEVSTMKVIYEDNPSHRDILETYAIMSYDPLYNLDKVYKDNRGEEVRGELSGLYYDKEELEITLYELRDLRSDLITKITPPTIGGTYGYFGRDTEVDNRRYADSLTALHMFRETYDVEDEFELHEVEREIEAVERELDAVKDNIDSLLTGLRV